MASTRDFAEVLRRKVAADPRLAAAVAEAGFQANIAEQIYYARTEAAITQTQLARTIGTHQSVIARLEDADYEGHSLSMLRRIADATGKELVITFKDKQPEAAPKAVVPLSVRRLKSTPSLAKRTPAASKAKSVAPARKRKRNSPGKRAN
jgi:transcriptional regulator with XRE-family HTH domain